MAITGALRGTVFGLTTTTTALDIGTGIVMGAGEEAIIEAHIMAGGATYEAYIVIMTKCYQGGVDGSLKEESGLNVDSLITSVEVVSGEVVIRVQSHAAVSVSWGIHFTVMVK